MIHHILLICTWQFLAFVDPLMYFSFPSSFLNQKMALRLHSCHFVPALTQFWNCKIEKKIINVQRSGIYDWGFACIGRTLLSPCVFFERCGKSVCFKDQNWKKKCWLFEFCRSLKSHVKTDMFHCDRQCCIREDCFIFGYTRRTFISFVLRFL